MSISETKAEIETANRELEQAVQESDASRLASHYTKDAVVFPSSGEKIEGREAIEAFWEQGFEEGIAAVNLSSEDVEQSHDTAYENGRYEIEAPNGEVVAEGRYVVVWHNTGGKWKLHWDMFTES